MQSPCPNCSNKIVIDDARVPDRPFSVKCPKCQNAVKFPGKAAAAAGAPPPPPPPDPGPVGPSPDELRAQMMSQLRREMALGGGEAAHSGERALVALSDRGLSGNVALMLTRLGYAVDTLDDMEEAARLLEQGVYQVVVTAPVAGAGGKESLYQKALRINPEARRRLFLVLVGENLKTADGTQGWVLQADMVMSSREAGSADAFFRATLAERARVYQAFLEAKKRADEAAGY